jgi:cysteine desulfurases, SufS subfamily
MNIQDIRKHFPILNERVNKKPLVYLDNAATTQKPLAVIEAISDYYLHINSNVHRGVHTLSQKATTAFENTREKVRTFINASQREEIIFTKGTTDSINLVASSFCSQFISAQDEVIISEMEHHSNIVPWQIQRDRIGFTLKYIPFKDNGELDLKKLKQLISPKTKIIALAHVSNVLGTVNPIKDIIALAHSHNIPVLIDGAQSAPHLKIDMQALDCDFYCFSAHKMYAPMGIGVLYGKKKLLDAMPPYQGGGEMIKEVTLEKTTFNELPYKFEAGTPSVADAIGFGAAIDWINAIGLDNIQANDDSLMQYTMGKLSKDKDITIYGTAKEKSGVISFNINGCHPFDIGTLLDQMGIAIRTGHHCAEPVMQHYGIVGTARLSFAAYTSKEDIDAFFVALEKAKKLLLQ